MIYVVAPFSCYLHNVCEIKKWKASEEKTFWYIFSFSLFFLQKHILKTKQTIQLFCFCFSFCLFVCFVFNNSCWSRTTHFFLFQTLSCFTIPNFTLKCNIKSQFRYQFTSISSSSISTCVYMLAIIYHYQQVFLANCQSCTAVHKGITLQIYTKFLYKLQVPCSKIKHLN